MSLSEVKSVPHGDDALASALRTIDIEIKALHDLAAALAEPPLAEAFVRAATTIVEAKGRLIVTGMGKSGHVGRKIAATLASTGTPSMFMHPGEASHGDLGMITPDDVVLALSWSGETAELGDVIAFCRRFGVPLAAITSRADSALGRSADICLALPRVQEACPNQLAPTSSTTVQLAFGDALAVSLIEARGFSAADFRNFHPGGKLGAQLMAVADLMARDADVPHVGPKDTLIDATLEMSRKRFGITAVIDGDGHLIGAFTDGDLRRSITAGNLHDTVGGHMSSDPVTIVPEMLASEALKIMNDRKITTLFVATERRLVGIVHLHDLLRAGVA
ncbi:SIS domain-containing protein [Sphingomonas sp. CJ20]